MKKVLLGIFAITLISATAAFADTGKRAKRSRAKTACTKGSPETRDCHRAAKCPNRPGCVCN